ncbi:MAG: hypothetical protein JWM36_645 [Hyphomicrobiales bacterium]|nr:hypothetical protein [Hyphomicrobiales bacterium]
MPVHQGLQRAVCEVQLVRRAMEHAFEQIQVHAGSATLDHDGYLVAMQSADTLGQTLAAVEIFISNIANAIAAQADAPSVESGLAIQGITLSAVAKRLAGKAHRGPGTQYPGACDFF